MRLDDYLVEQNIFPNLKIADSHILRGNVLLNDEVQSKCGYPVNKNKAPKIRIRNIKKYVSRSASKLLGFFEKNNLDLSNSICFDIGSSTGGFAQVLLEKNAKQIFCIDVGKNLLDLQLKKNNKIFLIENTNAKAIHINQFNSEIEYPDIFWKDRKEKSFYSNIPRGEYPLFITGDISFISLREVLPPFFDFTLLAHNMKVIFAVLLKPQFELLPGEKKYLEKGILLDKDLQEKTISGFIDFLENYNSIFRRKLKKYLNENSKYLKLSVLKEYNKKFYFKILDISKAKIKGKEGNQEYIIYFSVSREKQN